MIRGAHTPVLQEGLLLDSASLIDRMADDLRAEGIGSEREAIRLLTEKGYRFGDVAALAGDALTAARRTGIRAAARGDSSARS